MRLHICGRVLLIVTLAAALFPQIALAQQYFASEPAVDLEAVPFDSESYASGLAGNPYLDVSEEGLATATPQGVTAVTDKMVAVRQEIAAQEALKVDKVIPYDPAAIEQIGNQLTTGHSICCPSFSCAYADAVLDGTVRDHSYYCCYSCRWPDWGGGNSAYRCVGSDEQLLREAYDQIAADRPTVIHVYGPYGEHWIALIGYVGAYDPDHLTLDNFVALDPANGAQIRATEKYTLYGDGCEHVSDR